MNTNIDYVMNTLLSDDDSPPPAPPPRQPRYIVNQQESESNPPLATLPPMPPPPPLPPMPPPLPPMPPPLSPMPPPMSPMPPPMSSMPPMSPMSPLSSLLPPIHHFQTLSQSTHYIPSEPLLQNIANHSRIQNFNSIQGTLLEETPPNDNQFNDNQSNIYTDMDEESHLHIHTDSDTDDIDFIFEDEYQDTIQSKRNLYDYTSNINYMNQYNKNSNKYFINTIQSLHSELQILYKDNLSLTNNVYYLKNKNTILENSINNYKTIIKSNKKYMYELYHTKHKLLDIYDKHTANLKGVINNQNIIINEFKDALKCSICYENNINILFDPCNHIVMCDKCYVDFRKYDSACPLCKSHIKNSSKIFLPDLK